MPLPTVSLMLVFWISPLTFGSVRPAAPATLTKRTDGGAGTAAGSGWPAAVAARAPASAASAAVIGRRSVGRGNAFQLGLTKPLEKVGMHRELPFRLLRPAGLSQRPGQGVVRLGIDGVELEGAAEQGDRLLHSAPAGQDRSDVVVGVRIGGGETARLLELLQGLVVPALGMKVLGDLEVRLGAARDELDGALERRDRLVEPQPFALVLSELDVDPDVLETAVERG